MGSVSWARGCCCCFTVRERATLPPTEIGPHLVGKCFSEVAFGNKNFAPSWRRRRRWLGANMNATRSEGRVLEREREREGEIKRETITGGEEVGARLPCKLQQTE